MAVPEPTRPLRVLVLTPLGEGGRGGIDRMMDAVRDRLAAQPPGDVVVSFRATRGQRHIGFSIPLVARVVTQSGGRLFGLGPDVQHINLSSRGSTLRKLIISGAARAFGIPYVIHLHGSVFREYWAGAPPFLSARIRSMFAHAACILVLGGIWRDFVASRVPEAAGRIHILPNATPAPPDQPKRAPGPITILFLGHVGPRKGVPHLVKALSVIPRSSAWRAVIVGDGNVDQTRADVAGLGLQHHVMLPGWVGPAEVSNLLASADILVLPSFDENLPMSVIEGMAYGLAIVTTPVGAIEDIIADERTGLLVPPGDSDALARALSRLLDDPGLRDSLGEAAKAFHREHLEISSYVETLLSIWREVGSRRRLRGRRYRSSRLHTHPS